MGVFIILYPSAAVVISRKRLDLKVHWKLSSTFQTSSTEKNIESEAPSTIVTFK